MQLLLVLIILTITVLHYNHKQPLGDEAGLVPDYVRMVQVLKQIHLQHSPLLLVLHQRPQENLLRYILLAVGLGSHEIGSSYVVI